MWAVCCLPRIPSSRRWQNTWCARVDIETCACPPSIFKTKILVERLWIMSALCRDVKIDFHVRLDGRKDCFSGGLGLLGLLTRRNRKINVPDSLSHVGRQHLTFQVETLNPTTSPASERMYESSNWIHVLKKKEHRFLHKTLMF